MKIIVATSTEFYAEDLVDPRFYVFARLGSGILRFEIVALLQTGERGTVRGKELFRAMMAHFSARVRIIQANWTKASGKTTNLDQVNAATAAGLTVEGAAPLTWTGLRASEVGYDKVTVSHALPRRAKGNYNDIRVEFSR